MRKIFTFLVVVLTLAGSAYAAIMIYNLFPDTTDFPRIPATPGTLGYSIARMLGVTDIKTYVGDGTVANTEKLNGIPGTGYLQHNRCTTPRDVWLGVGTDGVPLCGAIGSLLAVEIGTLTGVINTVTIIKPDGTSNPGADGDTLYVGDIITTAESSSGAIVFTDASLIRLDELTTVELDLGENTDGQEVAQIILSNGDLWGRVLTTEGINFEAGGYIAGVRGTSISVTKDNADITVLIVDSTIATDRAAALYYNGQVSSAVNIRSGSRILATSGTTLTTPPTTPPTITTPGKVDLLTSSDWASRNTIADIEYMLGVQSDSTLATTVQEKIQDEFDVTVPSLEDTSTCIALGGTTSECDSDAASSNIPSTLITTSDTPVKIVRDINNSKQELKGLNMLCREKYNGVFWPTIQKCVKKPTGSTTPIIFTANYTNTFDPETYIDMPVISSLLLPQEENLLELKGRTIRIKPRYEVYSASLIEGETINNLWADCDGITTNDAPAKLSQNLMPLSGFEKVVIGKAYCQNRYTSPSTGINMRVIYNDVYQSRGIANIDSLLLRNEGIAIDSQGEYISYPLSEFPGGAGFLKGKTIEIEFDSLPTGQTNNNYGNVILDLGDDPTMRITKKGNNWMCGGNILCSDSSSLFNITTNGNTLIIKIKMTINAKRFVLGNNGFNGTIFQPINQKIKSIIIKE